MQGETAVLGDTVQGDTAVLGDTVQGDKVLGTQLRNIIGRINENYPWKKSDVLQKEADRRAQNKCKIGK